MYEDQLVAAQERRARLLDDAAHQRLVALATCCKPATWRRALARLRPHPAGC